MTDLKKGYKDDVGIDVCLGFAVEFKPFETKVINTGIVIISNQHQAVMMCARSSAAAQGIIVNQCPIDPGYTGPVHIIAHNCSNEIVRFKAGEAFAQLYCFNYEQIDIPVRIKKQGKRGEKNFGSSDEVKKC